MNLNSKIYKIKVVFTDGAIYVHESEYSSKRHARRGGQNLLEAMSPVEYVDICLLRPEGGVAKWYTVIRLFNFN